MADAPDDDDSDAEEPGMVLRPRVVAAARELDRVLRLGAASLPRDSGGILLGLLDELRILRQESSTLRQSMVEILEQQRDRTEVSTLPIPFRIAWLTIRSALLKLRKNWSL